MSLVRSNSLVPRTRQPRQSRREFISGESHWFEGRRYRLAVVESTGRTGMRLRPATGRDAREAMLYRWYRARLRERVPEIIAKWEPRLGVRVDDWRIRRMKTRWGTCNAAARRIWFNSELAKKPLPCLEYVVVHEMVHVVVHEMVHLVEPSHNERFREIMDRAMPGWPLRADELSRSHLPDVGWEVSPNGD